jgi:NodT family efflux transporter outer membrane factor (OMF) lipoprotein
MSLFGGVRRRVEQQAALVDVEQGTVDAAYLTLTGSVVMQAIAMANARAQEDAVQEIISVDRRNLELVQVAVQAGKSTGVDALAAEGQLASDRALLPAISQQYDIARHALAVLTGRMSAQWSPPEFRLEELTLPTSLPLSVPSELVRVRPDIRVAEAQLHAASAAVGVAASQLYPSVLINGSLTGSAADTGALFDPGSRVWSLAGSLTAPLFHGGTLRAQRRAASANYDAQMAQYQQVVSQAFSQVADALSALAHDATALEAQQAALATTRASMQLTQESFEAGQTSFLQLLEAQRLFQQARLAAARAVGTRYTDSAQYFLVLGGDAHGGSR